MLLVEGHLSGIPLTETEDFVLSASTLSDIHFEDASIAVLKARCSLSQSASLSGEERSSRRQSSSFSLRYGSKSTTVAGYRDSTALFNSCCARGFLFKFLSETIDISFSPMYNSGQSIRAGGCSSTAHACSTAVSAASPMFSSLASVVSIAFTGLDQVLGVIATPRRTATAQMG
jgi:hypothetical protein